MSPPKQQEVSCDAEAWRHGNIESDDVWVMKKLNVFSIVVHAYNANQS